MVLTGPTGDGARIIQSRGRGYFVEEGLYATREEAEDKKKVLMNQGYRLEVEKRSPAEIPEALF
jgi:hypothetical protein